MINTPFSEKHIRLGAKMAEFAGYNMPISYTGINDEHASVRNNAGVFDVSHMGEFVLKGAGALDLIQRVTTNDASKLTDGKAQYSALTNNEGGIVDDLIVYCLEENKAYMLVVNASNIQKDWNWISSQNAENVEMHNISAKTCLLAIQGPNACRILHSPTTCPSRPRNAPSKMTSWRSKTSGCAMNWHAPMICMKSARRTRANCFG